MSRLSRSMAMGGVGLIAASGILFSTAGLAAAATGTVGISPASGTDQDTLTFSYPQACSGGSNVSVSLTGGNSGGSYNLAPNSSRSTYPVDAQGGPQVTAATTIHDVAANNGFVTTGQTYTINAVCRSALSTVYDTFSNTITFASAANSDGTIPFTTPVPPAAALPEADLAVGLPLVAVAVGGAVLYSRRRRTFAVA